MCGAVVGENFNFRLKVVGMGMLAPSQERVHIRAYKPSRVKFLLPIAEMHVYSMLNGLGGVRCGGWGEF